MKPSIRIDAYDQGVKDERSRIVALLEAWAKDDVGDFDDVLAQVKGYVRVYYMCFCGQKSADSWQVITYNPDVHCPACNKAMVRIVRGA